MLENQCVDGGGLCTMCSSAGRCMKYQSQSTPFGHHHESIHCPETGMHCYDPKCGKEHCERKHHKDKKDSDQLWEEIMKKFNETKWEYYREPKPPIINVYNNTENIFLTPEEHHHRKHQRTQLVLSGIKYQSLTIKNSILMAISLNANEFVTSTLGLVDHATQAPITSASFSNQSYVSDQPGIASVDATGKVTAISAGTANITVTSDVSYTGNDGQPKTEIGKTLVVAVTVTGTPQTTDLTITFSAPQPVV
jgi:Big-like domain-containing protein